MSALTFVDSAFIVAQNKMGDNPAVIQSGSLLELESVSKGLRLPRIPLNDVTKWTLDGTAVSGMLIYNESGTVPKGIYYWNTTLSQWVKVTNATEIAALAGDVTGTLGATTVSKLQNKPLSVSSPQANDLLKFDGTNWINATPSALGNITLATGTTGTDVNFGSSPVSLGGTLTLNIPDAGNTAATRGVVNTGAQTFYGNKTFNDNVSVGGTLGVTGATTLSSTLAVTGNQTNTGNFSQTGTGTFSTGTGAISLNGATTLNGNTTLAAGKTFTMSGSTSGTLGFTLPATVTSYSLTWPSGVASAAGQVLTSTTGGVLSWVTPTTYTAGTGLTLSGGAFSINTSQNISTLSNLTSNGLVKTSGSTGALSVATSGTDYAPATSGSSILKGNGTGGFSAAVAGTDYQAALTNPVTATTATPTAGQLAVFASTTDVVTPTTTLPTTAIPAFTGDVTNTAGSLATTVAKLQNTTLSIGTPANGDVLQYTTTGTKWINTPLSSLGSIALATQNTGSDVGFASTPVSLGGTLTLNVPDAGNTSTTRGVVNAGAQTFYGNKTFNNNVSVGGTLGVTGATTLSSTLAVTGNQTNTGNFSQTGTGTFSTGTGAVSLNGATTAAGSLTVTGATALNGNTTLATGKTLTLTGLNSSLLKTNASGVVSAAVAGTDYQGPITLTTTGTSGAATLSGNTLNIPQYTGTIYTAGTGLTLTGGAFSVNTSQNISTLSNLTSNGLVKTSGSTGALSVATSGTDYAPATSGSSILKGNGAGGFSAAVAGTDYQAPISLGSTVDATTANGALFSGSTLTMGFATGSYPGLVSTGAQTFAGAKTFNGNTIVSGTNTFTVGTGATTLGGSLTVGGAASNYDAYNAGSGTTIDFTQSNLAYTTASAGAFTLSGLKDGGTYTLAVQGTTSGTATFTQSGMTFKSTNNAATTSGNQTIYTFIVMGTTVYFWMNSGF